MPKKWNMNKGAGLRGEGRERLPCLRGYVIAPHLAENLDSATKVRPSDERPTAKKNEVQQQYHMIGSNGIHGGSNSKTEADRR